MTDPVTDVHADPAEALTHRDFDLHLLSPEHRYKLMTGAVVPRPIAWVTTKSAGGVVNAAPFSAFVIVAYDPPLLGISIMVGPRGKKDTLINIETTSEFVVNSVPDHAANLVHLSAQDLEPEQSEVEWLGLSVVPSVRVMPPRLAISSIQMECRLHRIIEIGDAPNYFVIGEVVMMHIEDRLVHDHKVDATSYRPLARVGGPNYLKFGSIVSV